MTQPPEPTPPPQVAETGELSRRGGTASAPGAARPAVPRPPGRVRTPAEERHRARVLALGRLFGGSLTLLLLAYFMWTPGEWPMRLFAWVLLTILADEFGGWFGYAGLALGGLGQFGPEPLSPQWLVILPLVGGALFALLLVKHSGGPLVLPFAGLLFAGTLLAVGRYGLKIDPQLKLPADATFQRTALLAMLFGLGLSFLRQLVGIALRYRARRAALGRGIRQEPAAGEVGA